MSCKGVSGKNKRYIREKLTGMLGIVVVPGRYLVRFGDGFKKELRSNQLTYVENR